MERVFYTYFFLIKISQEFPNDISLYLIGQNEDTWLSLTAGEARKVIHPFQALS